MFVCVSVAGWVSMCECVWWNYVTAGGHRGECDLTLLMATLATNAPVASPTRVGSSQHDDKMTAYVSVSRTKCKHELDTPSCESEQRDRTEPYCESDLSRT